MKLTSCDQKLVRFFRLKLELDFVDSPKQEVTFLHDELPLILHLNLEKQYLNWKIAGMSTCNTG